MNSSNSQINKEEELGRAIARGVASEQAQKEKNQAKAEKRMNTIIRKTAEKMFFQ